MDSHFANPSGLNDENHYVSAYDMALITRYAFQNETFREIASTTYYELPPNTRNPEGLGVSPGNKMVKKNFPEYRPDVIGGKTGYTSIALNTLVIGARQDDTELITVVLHSNGTTYSDTSRLLDFGFQNFRSVPLAGNDTSWEQLSSSLTIAGLPTSQAPALTVDPDSRIVLPNHAEFDETTSQISFDLPENAPENAIAAIHYFLGSHEAGTAWLTLGTNASDSTSPIPAKLLEIAPDTIAQVDFKDEEEKQEGNEASASQEAAASQDAKARRKTVWSREQTVPKLLHRLMLLKQTKLQTKRSNRCFPFSFWFSWFSQLQQAWEPPSSISGRNGRRRKTTVRNAAGNGWSA